MQTAIRVLLKSSLLLAFALADPRAATASWPSDSLSNVALCTADSAQNSSKIVADGAGGAILAWRDRREGRERCGLWAQHVLAGGDVDPAWPHDGRVVCAGGCGWATVWKLLADGAGGVIVSWIGASNQGIYARHVLASGEVDAGWRVDGILAPRASIHQENLEIVTDSAGGAILTWADTRGDRTLQDIYAQHLLGSGAVDPAWPAEGRAICVAAGRQSRPTIVADGAGGAIVAWQDQRRDSRMLSGKWYDIASGNIFAQRVLASGEVDSAWPVNGRCLSEAGKRQRNPRSIPDGAGGAIVTWEDGRDGEDRLEIFAQRVLVNGKVDAAWAAGGIRLCDAPGAQRDPAIVADGAGGAIVSWRDSRAQRAVRVGYSTCLYDGGGVYAQHILGSGKVDPAWPHNGCALSSPASFDGSPSMVADGAGGAIIAWTVWPPGFSECYPLAEKEEAAAKCGPLGWAIGPIHAHHVLLTGAIDPAWPANGRILCFAATEIETQVAADRAGGVIVAFTSCSSKTGDAGDEHPSDKGDIFVKRVSVTGQLGGDTARGR